jgi:hypothetical protein
MVHYDIVCKYAPGLDSPQKIADTKLVILLQVSDSWDGWLDGFGVHRLLGYPLSNFRQTHESVTTWKLLNVQYASAHIKGSGS